jgi:hypothetical protein
MAKHDQMLSESLLSRNWFAGVALSLCMGCGTKAQVLTTETGGAGGVFVTGGANNATGGTGSVLVAGGSVNATGGLYNSVSTGGANCDLNNGDAGVVSDATITSKSICRPWTSAAHFYLPGDANSPCPVDEPTNQYQQCAQSLVGIQCAYASTEWPLGRGSEDVWACTDVGAVVDGNGQIVTGIPSIRWQLLPGGICLRSGNDCRIQPAHVCGLSGSPLPLNSTCADRALVHCQVDPSVAAAGVITAQSALDQMIEGVVTNCAEEKGYVDFSGALSVWFSGDCPTGFIVDPPDLADCIRQLLESERFDCASGLVCGASGTVSYGGCPC